MNRDYTKIKFGGKTLEDAIMDLSSLKSGVARHCIKKEDVLDALVSNNVVELRKFSQLFYALSGIYERVCNYFAYLYRYDWYIVPTIVKESTKQEEILKTFNETLMYLDNTDIKSLCGQMALEAIINGAYYGYIVDDGQRAMIQQLPIEYCRSRYSVNGQPAIEFNMKFFDDKFKDATYRVKILKFFPEEFAKGYILYKQNKLISDAPGDSRSAGWYLLDPAKTIKFSLNNKDIPMFVNAIPDILDLDEARGLDRRKQMQKLLKIIVQKLPLDKNGDLIFDIDEARDIHNNAVEMLSNAVGTDVLTTFADIEAIDMSDRNSSAATDDLERNERAVYNAFGVSQNLFNTNGNLSLDKSILNDESTMRSILLQFQKFFDKIVQERNKKYAKKYVFRVYMLETTQYNYKEMAKLYKDQTSMGYSKMLPQIALGHSQSSILNTIYFENSILNLSQLMIPPLTSSTINGEDVLGKTSSGKSDKSQSSTESTGGRPELPDDQKSDKTLANQESMS